MDTSTLVWTILVAVVLFNLLVIALGWRVATQRRAAAHPPNHT